MTRTVGLYRCLSLMGGSSGMNRAAMSRAKSLPGLDGQVALVPSIGMASANALLRLLRDLP